MPHNLLIVHKKRKKWPYILLSFFIFLIAGGVGAYYLIRRIGIEGLLSSPFLQHQIVKQVGPVQSDIFELLPVALGFQEPKTYLVLFLNNTELRPGGGFIGVYATVKLDKGKLEVLKVEGTEILDNQSVKNKVHIAPEPISKYLKVDAWYFRDSNWSPDFVESSKKSLELYTKEQGVAATDVDAVVGVTSVVLEEFMKRTGPLTVDGITFTPENVTAELEHEVEYNFRDRGIARSDRKDIVETLMHAILDKLKNDVLQHPMDYRALMERLVKEKHIIVYAVDPNIQATLHTHSVDGAVTETRGDYLMWVDANLGALKTDHAIDRTLSYSIQSVLDSSGKKFYQATATMKYVHTHDFDWRTSRYLTYARVYVPSGSTFISAHAQTKTDGTVDPKNIQSGTELGKQWFGTFISVEPLTTGLLSFTYRLPDSFITQIDQGLYTLLVQKQIGLVDASLTLDLNFDTTITTAKPPETQSEWGNNSYKIEMPLVSDHGFEVHF